MGFLTSALQVVQVFLLQGSDLPGLEYFIDSFALL